MDEATRTRVIELLDRPLMSLTVREVAFLAIVIDEHEDEVLELVPELAGIVGDRRDVGRG